MATRKAIQHVEMTYPEVQPIVGHILKEIGCQKEEVEWATKMLDNPRDYKGKEQLNADLTKARTDQVTFWNKNGPPKPHPATYGSEEYFDEVMSGEHNNVSNREALRARLIAYNTRGKTKRHKKQRMNFFNMDTEVGLPDEVAVSDILNRNLYVRIHLLSKKSQRFESYIRKTVKKSPLTKKTMKLVQRRKAFVLLEHVCNV